VSVCRDSRECYALSPVAAGGRWLLLLLSPLLSGRVVSAGIRRDQIVRVVRASVPGRVQRHNYTRT